jgi:hypothetical protein
MSVAHMPVAHMPVAHMPVAHMPVPQINHGVLKKQNLYNLTGRKRDAGKTWYAYIADAYIAVTVHFPHTHTLYMMHLSICA